MKEIEKRKTLENLKKISNYVRTRSLEIIVKAQSGHIGGNLSSVELMTALYFGGYFNFDSDDSKNTNRDRVLVRGHIGPLRYTIFSLLGFIDDEELDTYRILGSRLQGHEDMHETPGVDITPSGSLGMLLSYGVGSAISNANQNLDARTIVFLGDGEEQEGNISEAARHASSIGLSNLICILDKNKKQLSRPTNYSDGNSDIETIWKGYGWDVIEIKNGNDVEEVLSTYEKLQYIKRPTLVIANTTKGFGVRGAIEHFNGYHTLSAVLDKKIVIDSLNELKSELLRSSISFEEVKKLALQMVIKPKKIEDTKCKYDDIKKVFDISTTKSGINLEQAQDEYIKELKKRVLLENKKSKIYFVTPDLLKEDIVSEVGFDEFTHFIDTGIREQHAIGMCHGISIEDSNSRIYVCYGDAFVFRALDQINAASTGKSNIMIVGENSGIFQGQNGKTHQSVAQPGALMSIPELNFYEPADSVDLYNVFSHILTQNQGVSYVRLHRDIVNIERDENDLKNIDSYFIHKVQEPKLVIITSGFLAENAVNVALRLESEYEIPTNVINVVNQKTFGKCVEKLLVNEAPIITLYNGNPQTLSQNISNAILSNENIPRPKFIQSHGYENGTSGKVYELMKHYGFDDQGIMRLSLKCLKK
jgi:transketolase